ncbi:hypothetical protein F9C11_41005 [Amycolatopsis sp. VS8301801F10]|uniref:hypothetical protein n=1 Tax=unclassified Amycolatopsis TaxID=2618356 RepID=UPI0038FCD140
MIDKGGVRVSWSRPEPPMSVALRKAVEGLHKGSGVWHEDLRRRLGAELCGRWQIPAAAPAADVRVVVVARLAAVLESFGDDRLSRVFWAAFNVGLPRDEENAKLAGRCAGLGISRTKFDEQRELFTRRIKESLVRPLPPLGPAELAAARALLEPPPARPEEHVLDALADVPRLVLAKFPEDTVRMPFVGKELLIASLGGAGDWCCVFTNDRGLGEYGKALGQRWTSVRSCSGREAARAAARATAGLLVNPNAGFGGGTERMLSLPLSVVREIAGTEPR